MPGNRSKSPSVENTGLNTMSVTLVISDIHANRWALKAVLDDASQFRYDEIWFLGDLWGYGPAPYEVWQTLFVRPSQPVLALAGNHDWEICGIPAGTIRADARAVIQEHQRLLRPSAIEFLKSLPVMRSPRPGVYLAHGEIASTCDKSIRGRLLHPPIHPPNKLVQDFFQASRDASCASKVVVSHAETNPIAHLFAVGQTHVQKLWEWDPQTAMWHEKSASHHSLENLNERPVIFNPGSVGFPRADSGCPGYAIINWRTNLLSFHRVMYNTMEIKRAMELPPYQPLIADSRFFVEPHCQEAA